MRQIIPIAAALAISSVGIVGAQQAPKDQRDRTTTTETKVEVDDGRAITLSGCLVQAAGPQFMLRGATVITSDEVSTTTRVKTDVDDDGTEVTKSAKTRTETDGDAKAVGTSGLVATYELTAREGVELASHVGKQVQVTAVRLDKKDGDDDAEITVEERTRVQREDAPDSEVKTRTTAEVPRGSGQRITVLSVKPLGTGCS